MEDGEARGGTAAAADGGVATDDDDPVVQECDVYLNRMHDPPDFVGDMYVLQFPLRPTYRAYGDQGQLDKVELKEKARRLRFVYKLTDGQNYDSDNVVNEKVSRRHVLSSNAIANADASYAIAVIHQGKMTLTPIRAVNQLRPDLEDFDRERARRQAVRAADGAPASSPTAGSPQPMEEGGGANSSGDESGPDTSRAVQALSNEVVPTQIRVEYQPGPGGKGGGKGGTKLSELGAEAAQKAALEIEEPWTRLDYYNTRSSEALDIYEKHVVWPAATAAEAELEGTELSHPKLQELVLDGDKESFLSVMCGQADPRADRRQKAAAAAKAAEKEGLGMYVLSRMPVERQVEALARHYVVMSFSRHLRKRLPPATLRTHGTDEALFELLRKCSQLVCGNWVLKSELAGFERLEAHARNLMLIMCDRCNGALNPDAYGKWIKVFRDVLPSSTFEEITRNVMERDPQTQGFRLKERPDADFAKRYPKVVEEYRTLWEQQRLKITQSINFERQQGPGAMRNRQQMAAQSAGARQRAKLLEEVREVLALGAMTVPELRRTLQKNNPNVAIREEEINMVLQNPALDAIKIRDLWTFANTGNITNDKFRSVVHNMFKSRDSCTKEDILQEYERVHSEPCALSGYVLRNLLREIAEKLDGDTWVVKGALAQSQG